MSTAIEVEDTKATNGVAEQSVREGSPWRIASYLAPILTRNNVTVFVCSPTCQRHAFHWDPWGYYCFFLFFFASPQILCPACNELTGHKKKLGEEGTLTLLCTKKNIKMLGTQRCKVYL